MQGLGQPISHMLYKLPLDHEYMLGYHDLLVTPLRFCNNPLSFFQGLLGSKDGPVPGTTYLQGINSGQVSVNPKDSSTPGRTAWVHFFNLLWWWKFLKMIVISFVDLQKISLFPQFGGCGSKIEPTKFILILNFSKPWQSLKVTYAFKFWSMKDFYSPSNDIFINFLYLQQKSWNIRKTIFFPLGVIQKPPGHDFALFWPPTYPCGHF